MLLQTGECVENRQLHKGNVMDMQLSKDGTHFITASTDMTAKLVDTESLEVMKTYDFGRPCNSAAISPLYDHVSHPRHVKVVSSPQSIKMELSQLALIGNKPFASTGYSKVAPNWVVLGTDIQKCQACRI